MTRQISTRHPAKRPINTITQTLPLIISILISYTYAINNTLLSSALLMLLIGATIIRKKQHNLSATQHTYTISRLEDIFIFSGLTLNPLIPRPLGFLALAIMVLLPHIAQQTQSLKAHDEKNTQKNKEILPRTSTLLLLALSTLATYYMKDILSYALATISAATIYASAKNLQDTVSRKKDHL